MKIWANRIGSLAIAVLVVMYAVTPAFSAARESGRLAPTLTSASSAGSYTKDEIIYVNLTHDGSVDAIYVINSFDVVSGGTITDQGNYSEVNNLTTTEPVRLNGATVTTNATTGKFYYEGVLEKTDIPWEISVNYRLDGKPIGGTELAGQSGRLQIDIGVHQKSDTNEIWRDNYAVQASLALDSESCKNIEAPDATVATVGGDKQLSYIILPGKDKDFTITANVTDFELSGISFNMVPLSLSIDDPDTTEIKDKLYELQDGAVELDDGAFDLDDGATELLDGADKLDNGADRLDDGVNRLRDGVVELVDGVDELRDGADDLRDGASDLLSGSREIRKGANRLYDGIGELESGAYTFASGLSQLNCQSTVLITGSVQVKDGLGQLASAVNGIDAESAAEMQNQASQLKSASQDYLDELDMLIAMYEQQLAGLYSLGYSGGTVHNYQGDLSEAAASTDHSDTDIAGIDTEMGSSETDETLEDEASEQGNGIQTEAQEDSLETSDDDGDENTYYYRAATVPAQIVYDDDVTAQIQALSQTVDMLKQLRDSYSQINTGVTQMTDAVAQQSAALPQLAAGVQTISEQYGQLDTGITSYTTGVGQLYASLGALTGGISDLSDGISELNDGAEELRDGAWELYDGTYDLQDGVRKLSDGTIELSDGVVELSDGTVELKDGTIELKDGTIELKDGTLELLDGTNELREKTADMDAEIDAKIDEMMAEYRNKEFDLVSYVNASNQNISSVQFVMKTAEIAVEDTVDDVVETEAKVTFAQRFMNLFAFLRKE